MKTQEQPAAERIGDPALLNQDCPTCDEHTMSCMEVWGGNHRTHSDVVMPGLTAHVYTEPHDEAEAGGDIHYVSSCATGRVTRVLVADVAGHGESVASIAQSLRGLMQRFVNFVDQRKFMESLNRQFASGKSSGVFATAVAVSYWAPTGRLVISNAGHPPPLIRDGASGQWRVAQTKRREVEDEFHDLPLGVMSPVVYDEFELPLHAGDLVLLYTDSLIESRNAQGEQLDESGLLEMVESLGDAPATELPVRIVEQVRRRVTGPMEDDVTVLVLQATAGERFKGGALESIRAFGKFISLAFRSLFDKGVAAPWPQMTVQNIGGAMIDKLNHTDRKPADDH